jgi:hypothetical protein
MTQDFDTIFYALAFQHASNWLETADLTRDVTRINRSAQLVVDTVRKFLPDDCPEMQPHKIRTVTMSLAGWGPAVSVHVGEKQ